MLSTQQALRSSNTNLMNTTTSVISDKGQFITNHNADEVKQLLAQANNELDLALANQKKQTAKNRTLQATAVLSQPAVLDFGFIDWSGLMKWREPTIAAMRDLEIANTRVKKAKETITKLTNYLEELTKQNNLTDGIEQNTISNLSNKI